MSTTFVPNDGRILVRLLDGPSTTASGLITIPDSMKQDQLQGEVLAAHNSRFTVGTILLFGKYAGFPVTIDHEKLLLMTSDEVLGHFEPVKES